MCEDMISGDAENIGSISGNRQRFELIEENYLTSIVEV
jgi:hypothetical protein